MTDIEPNSTEAAPAAKGLNTRVRRLVTGGAMAAALTGAWAAATNVANYQGYLCNVPAGQPAVSDICGAVGAGGKPTRDERIAWASRRTGDCEALRTHIVRFPQGAYRAQAADLLQAAHAARAAGFSPAPRATRGYVRQSEHPFPNEGAARADAVERANRDAEALCAPVDPNERLAGADITPGAFDCRPGAGGGRICALDYAAQCRLEVRALVERCE
jgi:hypothetical protein